MISKRTLKFSHQSSRLSHTPKQLGPGTPQVPFNSSLGQFINFRTFCWFSSTNQLEKPGGSRKQQQAPPTQGCPAWPTGGSLSLSKSQPHVTVPPAGRTVTALDPSYVYSFHEPYNAPRRFWQTHAGPLCVSAEQGSGNVLRNPVQTD